MDLANLKNINVNDLFNKLKSGGFGDKKLLIKFGIGFGAILIFLIIYYVFVSAESFVRFFGPGERRRAANLQPLAALRGVPQRELVADVVVGRAPQHGVVDVF